MTKAGNAGERVQEDENSGTLDVVEVVVVVADEPEPEDSTLTASFMPLPQWPTTPQMK